MSASGDMTNHYLNPVVPENYSNNGTTASFAGSYERDLTEKDRLTFIARHELARYAIPNELVQQNGAWLPNSDNDTGCPPVPPDQEPSDCVYIPGGQLQNGDNFETMGSARLPAHLLLRRDRVAARSWPATTPLTFIRMRRPGL